MSFEQLGLTESLLRAVRDEGYHTATPIQIQAIPHVLAGRDLMGCAQTGTGKTAAFALPTLQRLGLANGESRGDANGRREQPPRPERHDRDDRRGTDRGSHSRPTAGRRSIRGLVLSPTRELAAQIAESFRTYGRHTGLRHAVVFGGVSQVPQVRAVQAGVDLLVATPGRLLDLMQQGHIDLSAIEVLILDEADQMLDLGFIVPLRRIVASVPRQRQTLMFSATMPDEIRRLATEWLREPAHVQVAPVATPAERVQQSVYFVEPKAKPELLVQFLNTTAASRTLVFSRTKHGADKIAKRLNQAGIRASAIHGNKSQSARQQALAQFKSSRPPVLVATDIAARGLDIDDVSHVINFDMPEVPEIYVHRIGRTGRAGAEGIAISFCGREERGKLKSIERLTRRAIAVTRTPDLSGYEFESQPSSADSGSDREYRSARSPVQNRAARPPQKSRPAVAKPRSVHAGVNQDRISDEEAARNEAVLNERPSGEFRQRSPAKSRRRFGNRSGGHAKSR